MSERVERSCRKLPFSREPQPANNRRRRFLLGSLIFLAVAWLQSSLHPIHTSFSAKTPQAPEVSSLPTSSKQNADPVPCRLDLYGGFARRIGKATGFFHVEKIGNRWWLVDPLGNPFWMKSIYNIERGALGGKRRLEEKYGSLWKWRDQVIRRMTAWGFNTTGEYSENILRPYGTYGGKPGKPMVPAIPFRGVSSQGELNSRGWMPERLHNIIAGVPRSTYNDWRGPLLDIFDPDFVRLVRKTVQDLDGSITGGLASQQWIVGVTLDDADKLYGFKGEGSGGKVRYPHPAFMVLTTKPTRKRAIDPKVYSKYALRDHLKSKYVTLQALNAAWGSRYTNWDSNGGFGVGTGLLDEDGTVRNHPWIGSDPFDLSNAAPALKQDMDDFLFKFASHYFKVIHDEFRAVDKKHLLFGPASLGAWGGRVRKQVLAAGKPYVDVWQFTYDRNPIRKPSYGNPDAGLIHNFNQTGQPAFVWIGQSANADSPLSKFPDPWGMAGARTQEERAKIVAFMVNRALNAQGSNGDYFVVGYDFWSWADHGTEKTSWGLVTSRDNAYDGREATIAPGHDPWGYSTGGEKADYGDFLTTITALNKNIYRELGLTSTSCGGEIIDSRNQARQ